MKSEKEESDETEIRPRPDSWKPKEYEEPIERFIQADEGLVSYLSQIGPRPRSAR